MDINQLLQTFGLPGAIAFAAIVLLQVVASLAQTAYTRQKADTVRADASASLQKTVTELMMRSDAERQKLTAQIDALRTENTGQNDRLDTLTAEKATLQRELADAQQELQKQRQAVAELTQKLALTEETVKRLEDERTQANQSLERERTIVAAQTLELDALRKRVRELENEVGKLQGANDALLKVLQGFKLEPQQPEKQDMDNGNGTE